MCESTGAGCCEGRDGEKSGPASLTTTLVAECHSQHSQGPVYFSYHRYKSGPDARHPDVSLSIASQTLTQGERSGQIAVVELWYYISAMALLTLGTHAARTIAGLSVSLSVCLRLFSHCNRQPGGIRAIPTAQVQQALEE